MVRVSFMEFLIYSLLLDAGMRLEETTVFVHLGHLVLFDNILIISSIFVISVTFLLQQIACNKCLASWKI